MSRNVVVAQSGGPSPVINSSLKGVIDGCMGSPDVFGKIYGGWHGVEGILKEEFINISAQPKREIKLLGTTPAAGAIGTCRYKLRENQRQDFMRILEVFKAHDVGYFFYIGGNDSMDTANKISRIAAEHGLDLICTGVPKTIDNDVGDAEFKLIDHTPGYGSVARYWACCIQNANEENAGACTTDPVAIMQVMGRRTGFIPAAARLADPGRRFPMLIIMPEAGYTMEQLADLVNDQLKRAGRCMVVLSEGFDVGDIGARKDAFGHIEYGASEVQAADAVAAYLNKKGIAIRGHVRSQVVGCDQRDTMIYASTVDLEEAWQVGMKAVEVAKRDGTGWMATILREPGLEYKARYDKVRLELVANSERTFPLKWLSPDRTDVTDDYVRYAKPLMGDKWVKVPIENGIQRFARFKPAFIRQRCPSYVPEGHRTEQGQ